MRKLTLTNHVQSDTTVLENEFIDHYMAEANGEYVKVYLILLRHLNEPSGTLTISKIADLLDITEKDVIRALNYWKKKGLLDYDMPVDGETPAIPAQPRMTEEPSAPEPAAPSIQPAPTTTDVSSIEQYRSRKEFKELLFVAEQYLGKTLTSTDMETLLYLYDEVHMSADLLEYLIEYCVSKGSTSIAYIRTVGLAWADQKITTVAQAKEETNLYNKNYFTILKAFGIKNRNPLDKEIQYMNLWLNQYSFTLDIISEACSRTVLATGKASFSYADSILENWFKNGVHHLSDIESLDQTFQQKKIAKASAQTRPQPQASRNKFNNFHQRNYNMAELEKQLLGK